MNTTALYKNYKQIIEKILFQFNDYILKSMLFEKFNNYLEAEGYEKKSIKTLDRIIEKMIEEAMRLRDLEEVK